MQKYNNKPLSKQPINSCFIIFENKFNRDATLNTFSQAQTQKPLCIKIKNLICRILNIQYNQFDYGKNSDSDVHNKVFMRKYIPLIVRSVPKPEFIIWQNLDFSNKGVGLLKKLSRWKAFIIVNIVAIALTYGLCYLF